MAMVQIEWKYLDFGTYRQVAKTDTPPLFRGCDQVTLFSLPRKESYGLFFNRKRQGGYE